MNLEKKDEIQPLLQKLLRSVYSECNKGLIEKRFKPESEPYYRRKVHGFKYDDNGIHFDSWEPERISKHVWYDALSTVQEEVRKLGVYNEVSTKICSVFGIDINSCHFYLSRLTDIVAWEILGGKILGETILNSYVESFIKHLNNEEEEHRVTVQIQGIVLRPELIHLDKDILLRKPTQQDIEVEYPIESPFPFSGGPSFYHFPTAIVKLKGSGPSSAIIDPQELIDKTITVLSLFRVGGIEYIKYTTQVDSLFPTGVLSGTRIHLTKSGSYIIRDEDVAPLATFWSNMRNSLPDSFYPGSRQGPDELSIAYDRYNDSLEGGIIEKRISSAVMGLEALYLREGEQQEMSYRLRMRASKLLSLIGYNPTEVREGIKDAYNEVRSEYVHGGLLKQKDRQKLERKYGDMDEFSKTILDYLRASIVALLRRPAKASLIKKIDDSFLDSSKEEEIRKLIFMPYDKEVA